MSEHARAPAIRPNLHELGHMPDCDPEGVRPRTLTLDLTHRCPCHCEDCIEREAMCGSGQSDLSVATICQLITTFWKEGGEEVLLYGGEPIAHPHFDTILWHAACRMPAVRLVTNGVLLDRPHINEALLRAAQTTQLSVRVSLNAATAATHELLHRAVGLFHHAVGGLKALRADIHRMRLGLSYLVADANAGEILRAYDIAREVHASDFCMRARTGLHGIGVLPLSHGPRRDARAAVAALRAQAAGGCGPVLRVAPWFARFLETNEPPDTGKPFPACYFCGASRLVITPPEPGVAWACTYWRGDPRFHIANLADAPLGSEEFERRRIAAIRRVLPPWDCRGVICNREEANRAVWAARRSRRPCHATGVTRSSGAHLASSQLQPS